MSRKSRHLSALPGSDRLTRSQVAERLGVSVSTVRRYEGTQLHPTVDENDVRWFPQDQVTAFAARIANERNDRPSRSVGSPSSAPKRSAGELAALVFERFEQRQSLAEIVIGLRIEPSTVRVLFEQWSLGLIEGHLRSGGRILTVRESELHRVNLAGLAARLSALPCEVSRISLSHFRGTYQDDGTEFADLVELGGFQVGGPIEVRDLVIRFGSGDYRVTAYGFNPPAVRWEVLALGVS